MVAGPSLALLFISPLYAWLRRRRIPEPFTLQGTA